MTSSNHRSDSAQLLEDRWTQPSPKWHRPPAPRPGCLHCGVCLEGGWRGRGCEAPSSKKEQADATWWAVGQDIVGGDGNDGALDGKRNAPEHANHNSFRESKSYMLTWLGFAGLSRCPTGFSRQNRLLSNTIDGFGATGGSACQWHRVPLQYCRGGSS